MDVISLYPYICKYGKFPVCHPKVYVGASCPPDCLDREGIMKCKVLPPRKLYHPVLPYIFPNNEVVWISWKFSENNVTTGKNVNVAIAAYVTTQARLKLYEYLSSWVTLSCTVIQTRLFTFRIWMKHQKSRLGIIWGISQINLKKSVLVLTLRSLYRVALKILRYIYLAPLQESVQPDTK